MGLFSPNPERLARLITVHPDRRERLRLFRKLLTLTPTTEWFRAVMVVAMNGRESEAKIAVELIAQILVGEERVRTLLDIAKHGEGWETAMEQLRRGPIIESVIDGLCDIIVGADLPPKIDRWNNERRQKAAQYQLFWLSHVDERIRLKYISALLKVVCEGRWRRDEGTLATTMFHKLTSVPPTALDNIVIPELTRRVMEAPLAYDTWIGRAAPEQVLHFLRELQKHRPERVKLAFEAIEEDTMKLHIESLPETRNVALQGERFEVVAGAVKALRKLSDRGVAGAAEALEAFRQAPARKLPERVLAPYDYWDAGERFTAHHAYDELVSTATLGQKED